MTTTPALVDVFSTIRAIPGLRSSSTTSVNVNTGSTAYALSVNTMVTTVSVLSITQKIFYVNHQLSWRTAAAPASGSIVQSWFSPKIASGSFTWVNCIGQATIGSTIALSTSTADNSVTAGDIAVTLKDATAASSFPATDKLANDMANFECDTPRLGANGDWTSLNVLSSIMLDKTITGINGRLTVG